MKRIVFEKLTVKEEQKIYAGDCPAADMCEPDIPRIECNVNSSVDSGCNPHAK
ncbi:MAG: hypothetical protein KAW12_05110 [Candidatus Aminicenantes bacterium]|nr:hypothetical protein [Candidatus Aminicenantes bacterium]